MINHTCDDHSQKESDYCFCQKCLDDIKQESYDEGYEAGKKEPKE